MKLAPYAAVLGAAALTGWVSSPVVAFPKSESARQTSEHVGCPADAHEAMSNLSLAWTEGVPSHQHGPSCNCAACAEKLEATK